jgi:circadian clock protein KaiC
MYTLDEIIHLTGIPANTASEVCRLLCNEGYLIFDESSGKYMFTKDEVLWERIRTVRKNLDKDAKAKQIYSKIEDIIKFGKPLALSEKELVTSVTDIGIPGLNIIFGGFSQKNGSKSTDTAAQKTSGLLRGHCVLIKGEPGTGKTTMGMQIAVHLAKYRTLFLTFEENIAQLHRNLEVYCQKDGSKNSSDLGWEKSAIKKVTRTITKIQTPSAWEDIDIVLQEIIAILDRELPQLIVVDSISRFRDLGGETKARQVLRRLIRILKIRGITSIFLGEERGETNAFEEYEADGVINLEWLGDQLSLKVSKLRGLKAYKGPHSAALLTKNDFKDKEEHRFISGKYYLDNPGIPHLKPGLNVFPEISIYKDMEKQKGKEEHDNNGDLEEEISTGTEGLNRLLTFKINNEEKKGFKKGETVLIIGSAGSGKTLLALNFMRSGYLEEVSGEIKKKRLDKNHKLGIWINLEGDIGTLKFAFDGFEGDLKKSLKAMIDSADLQSNGNQDDNEQKENEEYFKFFNFPPLNLDLNKIVYTLEAIHRSGEYTIDRLVIDSITELERAKSRGQPEVKSFLAGLIQFLRDRKITTIFISRSDTFFRSIDKIEEQVSSLVDLIICIRNFDMHNRINKGLYIQKARGRAHDSRILRMNIDSSGIKIEDSGWDVENLLAGDTSYIQGPKVFFKLFYENPAEEEINEAIINDFDKKRYPGEEPAFSVVKKTSIHTEFWSFRGQYSAGHANTRVLSIADHVISAFRDNDKLAELKYYVKNELIQNIKRDRQLLRLYNPSKDDPDSQEYIIDAIPCYRDYGLMVYKPYHPGGKKEKQRLVNFIERFVSLPVEMNKSKSGDIDWLGKRDENKNDWSDAYTWDNLLLLIKKFGKNSSKLPFAFPSLEDKSEFIVFFMELLWSYGGDIYHFPIREGYKTVGHRLHFKKKIRERIIYDLRKCEDYLKKYPTTEDQKSSLNSEKNEESVGLSNEKKVKIIKSLFENLTDDVCLSIYKQIENRFNKYEIGGRSVSFETFMQWVDEKIVRDTEKNGINVLNLDDISFKDTIRLIMKLIHDAGVPNPIHGDFRDCAILSRRWYSQLYKAHQGNRKLLPLPLAKNKISENNEWGYYRSVNCIAYWSLVMLKNALSPEIGGNFIESMIAPEYYKRRLKMRAGMPSMNWELEKKEFIEFDPDSFGILSRTINNGLKNEDLDKGISKELAGQQESKRIKKQKEELKKFLDRYDHAFSSPKIFEDIVDKKVFERYLKEDENLESVNKRLFYPKLRQTRIAFYQIEQALHYQLRQMLIPDPNKEEVAFLGDIYKEVRYLCLTEDKDSEKPQEIKDEIKALEDEFKKKKKKEKKKEKGEEKKELELPTWDDVLKKIINELRLHLVLELLMYFYHQDKLKGR